MQIRLKNNSKFEEEVKRDLFKIMTATKLKMCDPSKVKCPHVTLFEQLERLLSTKQEEEEPLIKHTKRFKQAQDNIKSIMGTEWLCKFVENTEQCINETETDIKKNSKKTAMSHSWHVQF